MRACVRRVRVRHVCVSGWRSSGGSRQAAPNTQPAGAPTGTPTRTPDPYLEAVPRRRVSRLQPEGKVVRAGGDVKKVAQAGGPAGAWLRRRRQQPTRRGHQPEYISSWVSPVLSWARARKPFNSFLQRPASMPDAASTMSWRFTQMPLALRTRVLAAMRTWAGAS